MATNFNGVGPAFNFIRFPPNVADITIANASPFPLASFIDGPNSAIEGTIAPGQDIDLTWQYWSLHQNPGTEIIVNIYLALPTDQAFAKSRIYTTGPISYTAGGVSGQTTLKSVDPKTPLSTDALLIAIYEDQSDMQVFYLEAVLASGGTQPLATAYYYFAVVPPQIGNWSTWDSDGEGNYEVTLDWGPPSPSFAANWNEQYNVGATFTNESAGKVVLSGQAALQEAEVIPYSILKYASVATVNIPSLYKGEPFHLIFPPFKKTWSWLAPVVWIQDGPFSKWFAYQITFSLADQYGSVYSAVSGPLVARVGVSASKQGYAAAALANQVAAVLLFSFSWILTPAAGAAAAAVATALGKVALDPPSPSLRYKKLVVVRLQRAKRPPKPELASLYDLLASTKSFTEVGLVLYEIEARVLGAIVAKDKRALKAQKDSYNETVQRLNLIAERVYTSAKETAAMFGAWAEADHQRSKEQIMRWISKPGDIEKLDIPKKGKEALILAVSSNGISQAAIMGVEQVFVNLANCVLRASAVVSRDRFRVINLVKLPGKVCGSIAVAKD